MFRELESTQIVATLEQLTKRISERFPDSGLSGVASELLVIARLTSNRAYDISRPIYFARIAVGALILTMLGLLVTALSSVDVPVRAMRLPDFIQVLEAGINDVILIGAGVFFLTTIETRIKRSRALAAIHELRSIAHVIDMHQLVKDPSSVQESARHTSSSPKRTLDSYELKRYLDYCSELLSHVGKLAALYAQHLIDPVVLGAVNEVEALSSGLSRKVWQKIMVLHEIEDPERQPPRSA